MGELFRPAPVRSVAQTYLRPKLCHYFWIVEIAGSFFWPPDPSSWENIQLFIENSNPTSKILDDLTSGPKNDLKFLKIEDLDQLSSELRSDMIDIVSKTGGHLGAGLGVVELAIAIHYVFDTPKDKLVWDVSHQCYPHKIITGRRDKIKLFPCMSSTSMIQERPNPTNWKPRYICQ